MTSKQTRQVATAKEKDNASIYQLARDILKCNNVITHVSVHGYVIPRITAGKKDVPKKVSMISITCMYNTQGCKKHASKIRATLFDASIQVPLPGIPELGCMYTTYWVDNCVTYTIGRSRLSVRITQKQLMTAQRRILEEFYLQLRNSKYISKWGQ